MHAQPPDHHLRLGVEPGCVHEIHLRLVPRGEFTRVSDVYFFAVLVTRVSLRVTIRV